MATPFKELLSGHVKLTVWRNSDGKETWNSITLARIYKDEGGTWQRTPHLKEGDLLDVVALALKAHELLRLKEDSPRERPKVTRQVRLG